MLPLVPSFIGWVCFLVFAEFTNKTSFTPHINTKANVLLDRIHRLTTHSDGTQWIDHSVRTSPWYGVCDVLLLPPFLLFVFSLWKSRSLPAVKLLLSEFFMLHSALVVLRAVSINLTTVPSSVSACHGVLVPPHNMFLTTFCNDQLFSGHTTMNLLCITFVEFAPAQFVSRTLKTIGWCVVLCAGCISIVSRDHYSVDVLFAFTHTIGLCCLRRCSIVDHWNAKVKSL